jgi:Tfp pilus assembly protein PilV
MPISRRRGGAMIEVVISVLILALAVPGIFGAMLSATGQTSVSVEQERAALEVQSLLEELRNYVTANPASSEGPGAAGGWVLPGDSCACWALQAGDHEATERLPRDLRDRGARLRYTVDLVAVNGEPVRRVHARVDWGTAP